MTAGSEPGCSRPEGGQFAGAVAGDAGELIIDLRFCMENGFAVCLALTPSQVPLALLLTRLDSSSDVHHPTYIALDHSLLVALVFIHPSSSSSTRPSATERTRPWTLSSPSSHPSSAASRATPSSMA